jgi:PAS domain S-box-containing protein
MPADGPSDRDTRTSALRRPPLTALTIVFVFAICATLLGSEGWRVWNAREQVLDDNRVEAANLAQSLGQHAKDAVKLADTILVGMVERLEADDTGPDDLSRLHRLLARYVAENPVLNGLFVFDDTGAWIANSEPPPGANNADREYLIYHGSHADEGGPHLGPPLISRSSQAWVIPVSRRFNHPDGSFAGVVVAMLDVAYFQRFYATFDIGAKGAILLALRDGTVLVRRPVDPPIIGHSLATAPLFKDYLSKSPAGVAEIKSSTDAVVRLYTYQLVEDYPLLVSAALARDEILAKWRHDAVVSLIVDSAVMVVLGGLGCALAYQIGRIARAERSAAAAGAHYRLLADHSADVIAQIGDGWIAKYVSPAARQVLGYEPAELVGTAVNTLIHEDDRPLVAEHVRRVSTGSADAVRSHRIRRKDGRHIWVEAAFWLVAPQRNRSPEFVVTLRDIGQRKEAETRLLDAIEGIQDGFVLWDGERRFVLCNSRFRALFGFGAELASTGVPMRRFQEEWAKLAPLSDSEIETPGAIFAPGEEAFGQREWYLGDGRWVLASNRYTALRHLVGIFTDITERKQHELELAEVRDRLESQAADLAYLAEDLSVARDEAERANRLKSEFLAMMSHEIRTPMNGIIGMNGLVLATQLSLQQRKYAENVRLSAQSLLTILNDILDVSKLEAGKFDLEAIELDIEEIAGDAIELLAPKAYEKGLEVAAYIAPGVRRPLIGDPTRLRQVLLNLLSNAIKFTDHGAVGIEIDGTPDGDRLRLKIAVADTGIGIKDADKRKLFRKFEQADGSITRRFGGTGLGLHISKQLVDLMGGSIVVADRAGGGTVFILDLSLATAMAPPVDADSGAAVLDGRRLLVLGQNDLAVSALRRTLADRGVIVAAAQDGVAGASAVTAAATRGEAFDVVLIDDAGRGGSFAGFADTIGDTTPRVVLMTASGLPTGSGESLLSRFDGVLMKPVRQRALVQCLAHLFGAAPALADAFAPEPDASMAAVGPGGHLLLAEDHEINREVAATILESFGYTLDFAEDGREAVAAARKTRYDLILMDVQMPNLDGLEATRQIRALGGAVGAVPIVAMTASAMEGDRTQCLNAGMNDYVSKPIDAAALLQAVARWVEVSSDAAPRHRAAPSAKPAPALPENAPPRDPGRLDMLGTMMAPDRLQHLLETFLGGIGTRLERLETSGAVGDLAGLRREAHDLISICGNLGEIRVQHLAERLQAACIDGDASTAAALVSPLGDATRDAADFVRRRLAEPAVLNGGVGA